MKAPFRTLLSSGQAAEALGFSIDTIHQLIKQGVIHPADSSDKAGRDIWIPSAEVERLKGEQDIFKNSETVITDDQILPHEKLLTFMYVVNHSWAWVDNKCVGLAVPRAQGPTETRLISSRALKLAHPSLANMYAKKIPHLVEKNSKHYMDWIEALGFQDVYWTPSLILKSPMAMKPTVRCFVEVLLKENMNPDTIAEHVFEKFKIAIETSHIMLHQKYFFDVENMSDYAYRQYIKRIQKSDERASKIEGLERAGDTGRILASMGIFKGKPTLEQLETQANILHNNFMNTADLGQHGNMQELALMSRTYDAKTKTWATMGGVTKIEQTDIQGWGPTFKKNEEDADAASLGIEDEVQKQVFDQSQKGSGANVG